MTPMQKGVTETPSTLHYKFNNTCIIDYCFKKLHELLMKQNFSLYTVVLHFYIHTRHVHIYITK